MELISDSKRILVIGALNVNPADRVLSRSDVRAVQLIDETNAITPLRFFDAYGKIGMSSMCWHPHDPFELYFASDTEVFKLCLRNESFERLEIPGLADIHEISAIGGKVWITNTRHDQIVGYDLRSGAVSDRIDLADFRPVAVDAGVESHSMVIDRFHCNQVFQGYDGSLCVLVHALSGRQLARKVGKAVIKVSALDGGVAEILSNKRRRLRLRSRIASA